MILRCGWGCPGNSVAFGRLRRMMMSPCSVISGFSYCGMLSRSSSNARTSLPTPRSEEHTSELQSLMRISYAVFCLKQQQTYIHTTHTVRHHAHITHTPSNPLTHTT